MIQTKSQFAKTIGVHKSTVTRMGKAGRLVLTPGGKVKVDESIAQISATQGHRSDVSERHTQNRGHSLQIGNNGNTAQHGTQQQENKDINEDMTATEKEVGHDRAYYKAITLDLGNKQIKLDVALDRGIRLDKEQHHQDIGQTAKDIKSAIERLIDNLAPQLAGLTCPQQRLELINKHIQPIMEQTQCQPNK